MFVFRATCAFRGGQLSQLFIRMGLTAAQDAWRSRSGVPPALRSDSPCFQAESMFRERPGPLSPWPRCLPRNATGHSVALCGSLPAGGMPFPVGLAFLPWRCAPRTDRNVGGVVGNVSVGLHRMYVPWFLLIAFVPIRCKFLDSSLLFA